MMSNQRAKGRGLFGRFGGSAGRQRAGRPPRPEPLLGSGRRSCTVARHRFSAAGKKPPIEPSRAILSCGRRAYSPPVSSHVPL